MFLPFGTPGSAGSGAVGVSGVGGFWGQTFFKPVASVNNGGNISANNAIKCVVMYVPFGTTVTGLALQISGTAQTGTVIDIALYNSSGVGIFNTNGGGFGGAGINGATTGVKTVTFTKVNLPAGVYYLAWTGTTTGTLASVSYIIAGSGNLSTQDGIAGGASMNGDYFTSSDSASSGILPSSLAIAHLTKGVGGFDPPLVWFNS